MIKELQKMLGIILMLVSIISLANDKGKKDRFPKEEKRTNKLIILMESNSYTPPV